MCDRTLLDGSHRTLDEVNERDGGDTWRSGMEQCVDRTLGVSGHGLSSRGALCMVIGRCGEPHPVIGLARLVGRWIW